MTENTKQNDSLEFACKFVQHINLDNSSLQDLHIIKRDKITKTESGTKIEPEIKLLFDYKRNFYTTKIGRQNHKQHKEWEDLDNLIEHKTTQKLLYKKIALATKTILKRDTRELFKNPYIYGADILSSSMIKKQYMDKFPNVKFKHSIGVCDIEIDTINDTKEIIMCSLTYWDKIIHCVLKSAIKNTVNYKEQFLNKSYELLGEKFLSKRGITKENIDKKIIVEICETPIDIIKKIFQKANEWMFDFLVFWNMDFDISEIIKAVEAANLNMADIISHPLVPKEYRYFNYKRGKEKKVTTSGLVTPIKPAARWHTVTSTSSFYVVDAMCIYKQVRTGKQEEQSYALDAILNKELGERKLKFDFANHLTGLAWHQFMQSNYIVEYGVYNLFDDISIEELDNKTKDVCLTFPMFCRHSDFSLFPSQPKRIAERLYYFIKEKGKIVGSTPVLDLEENEEDMDELTLSLRGHIVNLEPGLNIESDSSIILDYPELNTNVYLCCADLDVAASYPNNGSVMNCSKETTKKELISIENIDEVIVRQQTINLVSSGHVNAVDFCTTMFNFPQLSDWDNIWGK